MPGCATWGCSERRLERQLRRWLERVTHVGVMRSAPAIYDPVRWSSRQVTS